MGDVGSWLVEQRSAGAGVLHQPWPPADRRGGRILCRCHLTGAPAVVLGSGQPEATADHRALDGAGVELVRRRSGGGALFVGIDAQLWLDAWIPRHDQLWSDDIVRGAWWFGDAWAAALRSLGAEDVEVHRGRAVDGDWGRLVCFAGLGPGEVSVAGRKVVGLAQRRSAAGALLATVALLHWDPEPLVDLLAVSPEDRRRARTVTAGVASGLAPLFPGAGEGSRLLGVVAEAVVAHLP